MDLLTQGRLMRRLLRLLLPALYLQSAAAQPPSEYEVKAAFLYKFASFVQWPAGAAREPVCICVLGKDPFGAALDRTVRDKTAGGRPFLIRRLKPGATVGPCHILFVAASERGRLKQVLAMRRGEAVLTVSDVPGFCESGGDINLALADDRIQLEMNPAALERSGLQVSSHLLALARLVPDEGSR